MQADFGQWCIKPISEALRLAQIVGEGEYHHKQRLSGLKGNQRLNNLFFGAYGIAVIVSGQILGEFEIGRKFGIDAV